MATASTTTTLAARLVAGRAASASSSLPCFSAASSRNAVVGHVGGGGGRSPLHRTVKSASYFTNADRVKADDPYAQLGLTWGATTSEIRAAYKQKARELHPDVNKDDTPEAAIKKFQAVQKAYTKLMDVKGAPHRDDLMDEWSFAVWRNGDIIAQERTDVAGVARKRPVKPAAASTKNSNWGIASIGHPAGNGRVSLRRGEYIGDGKPKTSTVGTGRNKWVTPKEFQPWNPDTVLMKRAGSGSGATLGSARANSSCAEKSNNNGQ